MRVLHVLTGYPPTTFYTGPPHQVHRLAREFRGSAVSVRVVTTNADGPETLAVPTGRWVDHEGVAVFYGRRLPGTADLSWQAARAIAREASRSDLLHVTGIWSWANLAVARAARRARVPVVVSPRGSLDPKALAFSAGKKAWFRRLGGDRGLREAAAFHVTAEMEAEHVRALYPHARAVVVPNGVDLPADAELARWAPHTASRAPFAVFLGRIHAKKNVTTLVRAWAAAGARRGGARLVIAGPDDRGHVHEVARLVAELGLGDSVEIPGLVEGEAKAALLAGAACLILPSQTENFGNVVAEALAHGVPVIASTGTPWSGLLEHDCGWWVEPTAAALAAALDEALGAPREAIAARGRRGRAWMAEAFGWPSVARKMTAFYDDVIANTSGGR